LEIIFINCYLTNTQTKLCMETNTNDYRISFFKPTTPIALYNRNLVVWLVCIWAVGIFGFQITLKLIEKPTPEETYTNYESVWNQISSGQADVNDLQVFAQSCLSVLGKNFIQAGEKQALDNGLTWALVMLTPPEELDNLKTQIVAFENQKKSITDITDPDYVSAKNKLSKLVSPILGLASKDVRASLVSTELTAENWASFDNSTKEKIPNIMSKYLIHNQSFLTDFKFLGFPFHYFYTSIFLLVLFVGLCLLYCIRIDRRNIVLGIEDKS
jgi:putative solute:sodium symporter small subunit